MYRVICEELFDWEAGSFPVSGPLPYEEAVALRDAEQEGVDPQFEKFHVVQITEPRAPEAEPPPRPRKKPRWTKKDASTDA